MVVNPANGRVYVLDLKPSGFITYGYVHIIDGFTNQNVRTLTAGTFSKGMAFDGYNNKIYVTNSGDSNISVIDANTDQHVRNAQGVPKTIQLVEDPAAITFSYYSGRFYVGYYDRHRPGPAIAEVFGNTDTVGGRIYDFDREITGLMWPPSSLAASRIFALGGGSPAKVWTIESYNGGPSAVHEVGNSPPARSGCTAPWPVRTRTATATWRTANRTP
jgi:YVTN family beta-propeller protein